MLNEYLSQFSLHIILTSEEVEHFLVPREKVIESFVVENSSGIITDFISFYSLPSTVLNNSDHDSVNAAYCYYIVPGENDMKDLIYNALILAKQKNYDVFNALDIMHNTKAIFDELKFNMGDGTLNYYLYNWRVQKMAQNQLAITLV